MGAQLEEQQYLEEQQAREAAERVEHARDEGSKSTIRKLLKERQQLQERLDVERAERARTDGARSVVQMFLKENGFSDVNSRKKGMMSYKYPLHAAVEKRDALATLALLRCNADPELENSSKKTPLDLAESLNRRGSHVDVVAVLLMRGV